ncbi:unnamed protein product [Blepharisma stoltei]|uniref:Uncharacterized protein n=1 Tax=Blepharisma stoltei TaxID=1481888 RepID=A0AAU9JMY9_9CILI|nr:unnamed protein product [Blepharisma stoltei]
MKGWVSILEMKSSFLGLLNKSGSVRELTKEFPKKFRTQYMWTLLECQPSCQTTCPKGITILLHKARNRTISKSGEQFPNANADKETITKVSRQQIFNLTN